MTSSVGRISGVGRSPLISRTSIRVIPATPLASPKSPFATRSSLSPANAGASR